MMKLLQAAIRPRREGGDEEVIQAAGEMLME